MTTRNLSRRDFLKAGAGLHLGLYLAPLDGLVRVLKVAPDGRPDVPAGLLADLTTLGLYVTIGSDETVVVNIPRPDMGQGPRTSLAMAVAEELEVEWPQVRIVQSDYDSRFDNPGQTSGGSTSTRNYHKAMLAAGATARVMLVRAAARGWGVDASTCRVESGAVIHDASGRRATYGSLATAAAAEPVPPGSEVPSKRVGDYKIVGTPRPRLDNPDLVTGRGVFGSDVRVPGMLFAVIARPHPFGGRAASFDDAAARGVPGVRRVLRQGTGVAVVADNTWAAMAGREALSITWDAGPNAGLDEAEIYERLQGGIAQLPDFPAESVTRLDSLYALPYLAHAPMEPMVCVADVKGDRCEVWASTQSPAAVRSSAAGGAGVPAAKVTVHVMLTGGGFGRRLSGDYGGEAAALSKAVGAPVQVIWSRDDDMRRASHYRPASHHAMRGALDADGKPVMFHHKMAIATTGGDDLDGGAGHGGGGADVVGEPGGGSGVLQAPSYTIPNNRFERATVRLPVPTGAWRSVEATQVCFANECFIDELARLAGADPFAFRRERLSDASLRGVLELAAEKAGWGTPPPAGVGRGIACYSGFGSHAAHVVELTVSAEGVVRVLRVVAAINCGVVVNPGGARAQAEGGISDGVATALKAGLTIAGGGVEQSSFADYDWTRMDEMPTVEVHFVPHRPDVTGAQAYVGGLGEPVYPSVAPAIANAIFDLTGRRLRRLPIRPIDLAGWAGTATPTRPVPTATATATPRPTPTTPGTTPTASTPTTPTTPDPTPLPADHTVYLPHTHKGPSGR